MVVDDIVNFVRQTDKFFCKFVKVDKSNTFDLGKDLFFSVLKVIKSNNILLEEGLSDSKE